MVNDAFSQWLQTATRGLPKNTLTMIQEELRAHYEDAFADYLLSGKSTSDAQAAALADLGDAEDTSRALKQIHLAPRRYLLASFACISPLAFVITLIPMFVFASQLWWLIILIYPISFISTVYILSTFPTLLPYHRLGLPLRVMILGMTVSWVMLMLTTFLGQYFGTVGRWAVLYFNETILSYAFLPRQTYNDALVDGLILGALIVTALGALLFGRRILIVRDALSQVVAGSFIINGLLMLLHVSAIVASNAGAALLLSPVVTIALMAKYAACGLLFLRAARIGSSFPTQTA
jgi:hypothetical protein